MNTSHPPRMLVQHVRTLERCMSRLSLELPDAVADAMESAATICERFDKRPHHEIIQATLAALADDVDPATDPRVQAAVTSKALGSFDQSLVASTAASGVAAVVARHADEIVDLMRVPFDHAASQLTENHATLKGLPLDEVDAATRRSPDAAATLSRSLYDVLPQINAVIEARAALAALTTDPWATTPTAVEMRLAWCEPDPAKWIAAGLDRVKLPAVTLPYAVLTDGHRLAMATLEEYETRKATIAQAHIDAQAERDAAVAFARRQPSLI